MTVSSVSPMNSATARALIPAGELAFHYSYVPEGQLTAKTRLIRLPGLVDHRDHQPVTAAQLKDRTGAQAPPPVTPGQAPPRDPGMIPLTVAEVKRLLAAAVARHHPEGHAVRWLAWRRRHQARSRWFHQRTRLNREYALIS